MQNFSGKGTTRTQYLICKPFASKSISNLLGRLDVMLRHHCCPMGPPNSSQMFLAWLISSALCLSLSCFSHSKTMRAQISSCGFRSGELDGQSSLTRKFWLLNQSLIDAAQCELALSCIKICWSLLGNSSRKQGTLKLGLKLVISWGFYELIMRYLVAFYWMTSYAEVKNALVIQGPQPWRIRICRKVLVKELINGIINGVVIRKICEIQCANWARSFQYPILRDRDPILTYKVVLIRHF